MSKAFDTVDRKKLFEELDDILEDDKLHLLNKITNQPELKVKLENTVGESFKTNTGIMQGDCLSAVLFILYLAKCLRLPTKTKKEGFCIKPKYADDLTFIGTSKIEIDEIEVKKPVQLRKYNLEINTSKTERYEIPRPEMPPPLPTAETLKKLREDTICWSALVWVTKYKPPKIENKEPDWKECKLLGSKLDTERYTKEKRTNHTQLSHLPLDIQIKKNLFH